MYHYPIVWDGVSFSLESGFSSKKNFSCLDDLVAYFGEQPLDTSDAGETVVLRAGVGVSGLPDRGRQGGQGVSCLYKVV